MSDLGDIAKIIEGLGYIRGKMDVKDAEIDRLTAENERLKAFIADKIHDATRERMLMEIEYEGIHS